MPGYTYWDFNRFALRTKIYCVLFSPLSDNQKQKSQRNNVNPTLIYQSLAVTRQPIFLGAGKADDVAPSLPATSAPPPASLEPSMSCADRAVVRKMTMRLLVRKLLKNPNIWACFLGAIYSLASFGWVGQEEGGQRNYDMLIEIDGSPILLQELYDRNDQ